MGPFQAEAIYPECQCASLGEILRSRAEMGPRGHDCVHRGVQDGAVQPGTSSLRMLSSPLAASRSLFPLGWAYTAAARKGHLMDVTSLSVLSSV